MGASPSSPDVNANSSPPPAPVSRGSASERTDDAIAAQMAAPKGVHDEAMHYMRMHLCRDYVSAFVECMTTGTGGSCDESRAEMQGCVGHADTVETAYLQLQYNGKVQCPEKFAVYAECMDSERCKQDPQVCKASWVDLQMCAADHLIKHIYAQEARTDGQMEPPPMHTPEQPGRG